MSAPRILLTGAAGQLGGTLRGRLALLGEVLATSRDGTPAHGLPTRPFDLEDPPPRLEEALDRIAPDVIVNAAAYTAVDRAEAEPERARRVNAEGPAALAAWAARRGVLLVHFSTDYVFSGEGQALPWREQDPTAPVNAYGRSKLLGEQAIRAAGARHLILRSAWLYGPHGRNFVTTILSRAARGEPLRVVADQVGSPTSVAVLASATALMLGRWLAAGAAARSLEGTYHVACAGQASWHEFAAAALELAHAAGLLPRVPPPAAIASADWPSPARRPAWSVLDSSLVEVRFGLRLPHWREALAETIAELAAARAAVALFGDAPCRSR